MKITKDCGNCKFQKVPAKTHPCRECSVNASYCNTSMWKKKESI